MADCGSFQTEACTFITSRPTGPTLPNRPSETREMTLYSVKDWDEKYENNRSRDLVEIKWVPVPTKQDGDGYTDMVSMQDGAGLYGCWIGIVIVASKCKPRGTLIRETGIPHTAQSIARVSHLPEGLMARTLLVALGIKWLESVLYETHIEIPQLSAVKVRDECGMSAVPSIPFSSIPFPEGESLREGVLPRLKREIGAHFQRPDSQRWGCEEERLLADICKSPIAMQEWQILLAYRSKEKEYQRKSLPALLANWAGELDKARNYQPPVERDRNGNPVKKYDLLMPKVPRFEETEGL